VLDEPEDIFLPIGSSCTICGLIIGIALARKLKIGFKKPLQNFHIHGVINHHVIARIPFILRYLINTMIKDTEKVLYSNDCLNISEEIKAVSKQVILNTSFAGIYGKMSPEGERAKEIFEKGKWISINNCKNHSDDTCLLKPFLCSCFLTKCSAALLKYIHQYPHKASTTLLWETKSIIQPHSNSLDQVWENIQFASQDPKVKSFFVKSELCSRNKLEEKMHKINL